MMHEERSFGFFVNSLGFGIGLERLAVTVADGCDILIEDYCTRCMGTNGAIINVSGVTLGWP
jgi:hypothetical protein